MAAQTVRLEAARVAEDAVAVAADGAVDVSAMPWSAAMATATPHDGDGDRGGNGGGGGGGGEDGDGGGAGTARDIGRDDSDSGPEDEEIAGDDGPSNTHNGLSGSIATMQPAEPACGGAHAALPAASIALANEVANALNLVNAPPPPPP